MPDSIETETLRNLASQMGGEQVLARVVDMYRQKLPGEVAELEAAFASGDLELVRDSAHRTKSSSGQLGAVRLAGFLAELERAAAEGDKAKVRDLLAEVSDESVLVEKALADFG